MMGLVLPLSFLPLARRGKSVPLERYSPMPHCCWANRSSFWKSPLFPTYKGFLLMALPPGGFIMLAFLIVGKRLIDQKFAQRKVQPAVISEAITE